MSTTQGVAIAVAILAGLTILGGALQANANRNAEAVLNDASSVVNSR